MQLAKQLLTKPDSSNDNLIKKVDKFLDSLDLKIERRKKEKKLKDFYTASVKTDGMKISKVPFEFRDYTMCLDAVRNNGFALDFLNNPDEKLVLEAVKQEPKVISILESNKKTFEVCKTAYVLNQEVANYIPSAYLEEIRNF
jgi:hypothetical protein